MIKTAYLAVILLFIAGAAKAQAVVPAYGGGADLHDLSFGFTFQYVNSDYRIVKNPNWRKPYYDPELQRNITDSVSYIGSKGQPGFAVGFITRYTFTDHLELRTTPMLVFADRLVQYRYNTPDQNVDKSVSTTSVDVPLSFKLKSDRIGNFRMYMLGGVKYSVAINKKYSITDAAPLDKPVLNIRNFASYEAGIGCDIYFEYFKLSPELKLSNSFNNVLVHQDTPFANPISKLFLHTIMFSLHFE